MPGYFEGLGISLMYPENWTAEEDVESRSVTIESPGGTFLSVTRCSDIEQAFLQTREMMESEYDEVETEELSRTLGDGTIVGIIQRFVYLDLIVTSQLLKLHSKSLPSPGAVLVQVQGEDNDLDEKQPVFDAILTSLLQPRPGP